MSLLTPKDIINESFTVNIFGYDRAQVDAFLDKIILDYRDFGKLLNELKCENAKLKTLLKEEILKDRADFDARIEKLEKILFMQHQITDSNQENLWQRINEVMQLLQTNEEVFGKEIQALIDRHKQEKQYLRNELEEIIAIFEN